MGIESGSRNPELTKDAASKRFDLLLAQGRSALESFRNLPDDEKKGMFDRAVSDILDAVEKRSEDVHGFLEAAQAAEQELRPRLDALSKATKPLVGIDVERLSDAEWEEVAAKLEDIRAMRLECLQFEDASSVASSKVRGILDVLESAERDARKAARAAVEARLKEEGFDFDELADLTTAAGNEDIDERFDAFNAAEYEKIMHEFRNAPLDPRDQGRIDQIQSLADSVRRRMPSGSPGRASGIVDEIRPPWRGPSKEVVDFKEREPRVRQLEKIREEIQSKIDEKDRLQNAFLGKLRHGGEIRDLERRVQVLVGEQVKFEQDLKVLDRKEALRSLR